MTFQNQPCLICKRALSQKVLENIRKSGKSYDIYFCDACQTGITYPLPTKEELSHLYSSGSYRDEMGRRFIPAVESIIHLFTKLKKKRISKYVKTGKILDIGCGRGLFLNAMRKSGWTVLGTEFDEGTASFAFNVYGVNVITTNPAELPLPDESFDAIFINHVLEHVFNPLELISECRRILKPGGLLVIAVPDFSSLQSRFGKSSWFLLDVPCHTLHISEKGLCRLLANHSFKVRHVRRFDLEYSPFGWLQTMLNKSGLKENLLYDILKNRELRGQALSDAGALDVILTLLLPILYIPFALVLSVLEPLIWKTGGSIEVFATK